MPTRPLSNEVLIATVEAYNANDNAPFRKLAARFCKVHGLDLKAFY
jgi:hypothetical protein